ncbi:deoxyribonuclease V [Chloroflexota bacterium]
MKPLHDWEVSVTEAIDIQQQLAKQVSRSNELTNLRQIAGVDISVDKAHRIATGAVVVLEYPGLNLVETKVAQKKLDFPYVSGLLSFRELPVILMAYRKLTIIPDLIVVDGQGIAHPRRFGLASHLGLLLSKPTIGCAKSLLCGKYEMPDEKFASQDEITEHGEIIGYAVRTKKKVKPVFVSIGHAVDLDHAVYWVIECCRGYRLPEPTRLAHLAAGGNLSGKEEKS